MRSCWNCVLRSHHFPSSSQTPEELRFCIRRSESTSEIPKTKWSLISTAELAHRIENAGVEAEIAYRISAAWSVDANYSFLHMEHPVLAAPEHKLHVGASFTQGRWSVSTGLQYVEGLYTSIVVGGTGSDAQENFILWNLRAGFRISRKLRIFVDGENLLAQRYEINAGFPMPRATVLGGLDMHF